MEIVSCVLIVIYALLMTVSSVIMKEITVFSKTIMIIGSVINITYVVLYAFNIYFLVLLIVGFLLMHISAILNGLKLHGKINLRHHLTRFIFSILLIISFVI